MNKCFCFPIFVLWMLGSGVSGLGGKMLTDGYPSGNLRSHLDPCGWS